MRFFYRLGIFLYGALLRLIAPFHPKAKLWVDGRRGLLETIEQTVEQGKEYIWFHYASLGEFEQGRAVMEQIKLRYPHEKIIVTFFSPSGYEIRKNTALADYVFYLPEDTANNAKRFIQAIRPKFAVFTKYEYWYFYFSELKKQQIRLLMISAIFREDQLFFKPYGGFYRSILKNVSYFFAQNIESVHLLKWIGITHAGLAGDTRFDRVIELPKQHQPNTIISNFVHEQSTLVAGSTWPADEELLAKLLENHSDWKLILAPHEIHSEHIQQILHVFPQAIKYSEIEKYSTSVIQETRVLLIDSIGLLSSLYYYGKIAYIGGGFGVGIHNTLEAATYGIPVIFGSNYEKFQEAKDLIELGAGFSINSFAELDELFKALQQEGKRVPAGTTAKNYVQQRSGATQIILKYLQTEKLLS